MSAPVISLGGDGARHWRWKGLIEETSSMRKLFLAFAGVMMIAGSSLVAAPAMARSTDYHQVQQRHHQRPHYQKRHHRKVCRTVVRRKVVWRHHRRHVVRYKTRVCNWRR
jgi:hypothetical protein